MFIVLQSCNTAPKLTLNADEVYLVAYRYSLRNDSDICYSEFLVEGYTKIDYGFSSEMIRWKEFRGDYFCREINLSDSLKRKINDVITTYQNDSIFPEYTEGIYDGPSFLFLIKKGNQYTRLSGIPGNYSPDLEYILNNIYLYMSIDKMRLIDNQDSVKSRIMEFEYHVIGPELPPPPPLRSTVKFTPPVIQKE